jgi:ABC-type multidrug transport system fused ATPase/permease subunit
MDEEITGKSYDGKLLRRLLGYLWPYRTTVGISLFFMLLHAAADVVGPLLTRYAIDRYLAPDPRMGTAFLDAYLVEAGDDTQFLRKMALPILKSNSRLKSMFPEEWEKALALSTLAGEVAPPPGLSSPCSNREKSVAGAVSAGTAASAPAPWLCQTPANSGRLATSATAASSDDPRETIGFGGAPV